jgi:predicted ATPase
MAADSLREISIQGFKSISSLTVDLRPTNIVIGANGSGKSNFLEVFSFLREIAGVV